MGINFKHTVILRYDDRCNNNYTTFSITSKIQEIRNNGLVDYLEGCCHEQVATHFPELLSLIKWHLVSSDEPLHYLANTLYHASNKNYDMARECAVWPDAEIEDFTKEKLLARLPKLMEEFKQVIESFGFIY